MTLSIRLAGEEFDGFTNAHVTRNFEELSSSFAFATSSTKSQILPIREGDLVEIVADGKHIVSTGHIDEYTVDYDATSHNISVKGRSKTADLIDSTIQAKEYDNLSFIDICKDIAKKFKIDAISEVDDSLIIRNTAKPEIGTTAFKFLEKFARTKQVILTDDVHGNLVITRASSKVSEYSLQNLIGAIDNNILSASRTVNVSNLFGKYIVRNQINPIIAKEFLTAKELTEQFHILVDENIRESRVYEFYSEESADTKTLSDRVLWEQTIRLARNFQYQCTIFGHTIAGELVLPNIHYRIDDDFAQLHKQYFCNKVEYKYGLDTGSVSTMYFTHKDAYSLKEQDKSDSIFEQYYKQEFPG